ncbi:MAG: T9SS type A sorting domain-containing protein [Bacteroidetes bacterium]|nr:T9SS type A sorting domain-containing protein [Bacteroidota bacterium]MCL2303544.1 T9SS type A sorting domain-containing protein [Lentimicrobiaceae bacterium]
MKKAFHLIIIILLGVFPIRAQNAEETDFWLTFGANSTNTPDLQICIISHQSTKVTIYFTDLKTSVDLNVIAQQPYNYTLVATQMQAVYNTETGVSNRSIRITSDQPITVYAMNQTLRSADATNILPVMDLGREYYHISYSSTLSDAYAVVAIEDNTLLYHNGNPEATLDAGQVYYKTSNTDMTGAHITASNPVAFFALNKSAKIPAGYDFTDCLMQQLPPVESWGSEFFVPVSNRTRDVIRIVASENNTHITQTGGKLLNPSGGQTSLTNLQAGQFVELEVSLSENGCYIQTNKSVGVCTYLTSANYNGGTISDPAQTWLPPLDQKNFNTRISPFVPSGNSGINAYYALIATPTSTKENTMVSIGGASSTTLSGGSWSNNTAAGMSFYNMPLTNLTASYYFTNGKGLIVTCYGTGYAESYYHLASCIAQRATFYANNIDYTCLIASHVFCTDSITFEAAIKGKHSDRGSLRWYIDDIEDVTVQDSLTWSRVFPPGRYNIRMFVRFDNDEMESFEGIVVIGAPIEATPAPAEGGSVIGSGCYAIGTTATLVAVPNIGYEFVNWVENGDTLVGIGASYPPFTVIKARNFVANFKIKTYDIIVLADPEIGGTVSGGGLEILHGTSITVTATANPGFNFYNWTDNGVVVSSNATFTFEAVKSCTLIANFSHNIALLANPPEGGTVSGGGDNIYHGTMVTALATANRGYGFINWTENNREVSTDTSYRFTATESRTLTANFEKLFYTVNVEVNNPDYGYATGTAIYEIDAIAQVEAFVNDCYLFVNWTIDSVEVSTDNPYEFIVTESVNLIANFYALDFDTYAATICDNVFLLNLKKLAEEKYEVTGCKWFKNGMEENNTRTVDEFSYSAGINQLLESAPTYYMFQLTTENHGNLCSSKKIIISRDNKSLHCVTTGIADKLLVYPNPVLSGSSLTIEGTIKDNPIYVYNHLGACVHSITATDNITILTLNLPQGIYLIRTHDKTVKIMIMR